MEMVAVKEDTPQSARTILVAPSHDLEKTCEICFTSDKSRRLRCGHMLCRSCDQEWRATGRRTCPFCRASLSPDGEEDTDVVMEIRVGLPARLARAQRVLDARRMSPIELLLAQQGKLGSGGNDISDNGEEECDLTETVTLSNAVRVGDGRRMSPIELLLAQQGKLGSGGNDISDDDEEECDLTETVILSNAIRVGESSASGKVDGASTLEDGDVESQNCGVNDKMAGSAKSCSAVYMEIGTNGDESDPVPASEQAVSSVRNQRTVRILLQELQLDSAQSPRESHDVLNGAGAELGIPSRLASADSRSDTVYDEPLRGDSRDMLAVPEDPPGPLRSAWAAISSSKADDL